MVHHNIYDYKYESSRIASHSIELDAFSAQAQSIINEIIGGEVAVVKP